jgi:Zn-dependent M28 family amino/carboxypeptidase
MGSYIHAQSLLNRKSDIDHVIVMEMIGYYSDKEGSQSYPLPAMRQVYPTTGDFIAVVGNIASSPSVERIKQAVVKNSKIHCQGLVGPTSLKGIDFSDHLNYWALGMDAVMVTDTSFYRNPNYHKKSDTPETLDYLKMAEVVKGLAASLCADTTQQQGN